MQGSTRIAIVAAVLVLLAAACGNSDDGGSGVGGSITGDGSSTVFPITEAVAEEFRRDNPEVEISVGVSGTGGGFEKFCNGETDLQDASRPIKEEEKAACGKNGVEYVELHVANDGLAVVVNPANDFAECLTVAELKKIWEPKSTVERWKDVRGSFPDESLELFGPGTDSGTFDFFTKEINGEEGESRTDYTASEDDNVLVQGVDGDEGALGYFGFGYYAENTGKLKLVEVDGGGGCVAPSDETVRSGAYTPLARPLFVYVKKASIARPQVRAFMDFYLENVSALVADVRYTPLDDATLAAETAEWQAAAGS